MPSQNSREDPEIQSTLDSGESTDADSQSTAPPPTSESTDSSPATGASYDSHSSDATTEPENGDDLHFEDDNLGEQLRHASEETLDNAPFGIIRVDDEGTVEFFNQYESELSGMDPEDVKGRNFFTQVAPCTNNRLFRGRFKKGVRRGELDETFTYTYTYKMRPTLVDVHLFRDENGQNWITVRKY